MSTTLSATLSAALPAGGDEALAGWAAAPGRVSTCAPLLTPFLRATLNAGVRYSPVQAAAYAAVAADADAQGTLAALAERLAGGAPFLGGSAPASVDGAVLGALYDLLTLAYPALTVSHPGVAAWTAAVACHAAVAPLLAEAKLATGGVVRVGGQVDLRASPAAVAALADASVAANAGHKKAASQRDHEDAEREAKKAAAAAATPAAAAPAAAAPAAAGVAATAEQPAANKSLPALPPGERIAQCLERLAALLALPGAGAGSAAELPLLRHAPADTVEALLAALGGAGGVAVKNLFVKAKKERAGVPTDSRVWLVVAAAGSKVDLVSLAAKLGYGKTVIRFDTPESLLENLGCAPGNVSPLALANDTALRVQVALDRKLTGAGGSDEPRVWVHPLTNEASLGLTPGQLAGFIAATGHAVTLVDFEAA